ncbi:MAG: 4'-phosphopantetheinyl transferase superfamily protein [Saprospiraceae bacterium]|nr:4'-phosphopantetheinyl transferase superfamily protein [Saprospiraceae bacterium]
MPLLLTNHPFEHTTFALWQVAEPAEIFENDLPLSAAESEELRGLRNKRRLEWLASRWLLHKTTGAPQRMPLAKNAFSKPFFLDQPDLYCSLSHSHGVVGALTSIQACGCDIQMMVEKMPRIAPKFLSERESGFVKQFDHDTQFELFHLFWTAKESMYKQYGLKALDFRRDIEVTNVHWDGQNGTANGMVQKDTYTNAYHLKFGKIEIESAGNLIWAVCL